MSQPEGSRVQEVRVRCSDCRVPRYSKLDLNQTYPILTSTFIINGGDGYAMIPGNVIARTDYGRVWYGSGLGYVVL